jgi:nitrogen fixation NifU-like protein
MYQKQIMDHFRSPRNKGPLPGADVVHKDSNPLCSDEIEFAVRFERGKVAEARFDGKGCAIAMSSASMLTERVHHLTEEELAALTKDDVVEMVGVPLTPVRLKCATLALDVLQKGLKKREESGGKGRR